VRIRGLGVRPPGCTSAHEGEIKSLHDARMPPSIGGEGVARHLQFVPTNTDWQHPAP
jgi:hypothetical protein